MIHADSPPDSPGETTDPWNSQLIDDHLWVYSWIRCINELGKCPRHSANVSKCWVGGCNLDPEPACCIPPPSRWDCRATEARGGLRGGRGKQVFSINPPPTLAHRSQASSTLLAADQRVKRMDKRWGISHSVFLIQKQRAREPECPLLPWRS